MMTQTGFWRNFKVGNSRFILNDYADINNVFYLFPQGDGPIGSYTTFTDLKSQLRSRDLILLSGVLREQVTAPDGVFDVAIVGAANRPRQATSSGTPTGGGAYWTYPSSSPAASTPLLSLTRQGWILQNICFNPYTSSAGVRLVSDPLVDLISSGHTIFDNCYFVGGGTGQIGIQDRQGAGFVKIQNSRFLLLASAINYASIGGNVPGWWEINDNWFSQNTNDIVMPFGRAIITRNHFMTAGSGGTNKVINSSGGDGASHIVLNHFSNAAANIQNSNGYNGHVSDVWANYVTDQAALVVGVPGA